MKSIVKVEIFLLLFFACVFATSAHAHKVRIFAWQEGNMIYTEAKFSGGRPAQKAKIFVEHPVTGETLLSGLTDEEGNFQFTVPNPHPEQLNIVVDGGDGHKNSWTHTLETSEQKAVEASAETPPIIGQEKRLPPPEAAAPEVELGQLQNILEAVIDKKLGPIKKSLAEMRDPGPSLQDILGGIGYILGLAGIAAYFKSKKQ